MNPRNENDEQADALQGLWAGLDIEESAAPEQAFVIERFPVPAAAAPAPAV